MHTWPVRSPTETAATPIAFIRAIGLADELRKQDWAAFAHAYNGAGYRANKYDTKLAAAFARERSRRQDDMAGLAPDTERGEAVALQVALIAALGDALPEKLTTDGWIGEKTAFATRLFQRTNGLNETGEADPLTRAALGLGLEVPDIQNADRKDAA